MTLEKPAGIASDPFKSAKWDEITAGREFSPSDAPTLSLLVEWHAVAQRCMDDLDEVGGQVAYENGAGDIKPLPQLSVMKQASDEIRQLTKQLNLADREELSSSGGTVLNLVMSRRGSARSAGA